MSPPAVGVLRETAAGERRVALVPEVIARVTALGLDVLVEKGAGQAAWFPDNAFTTAGAAVVSRRDLLENAGIVLAVGLPDAETLASLHGGQVLIGLLGPLLRPDVMAQLARQRVTAVSLDGLPRTLSRAQPMDALTSQSNIAGYKAVVVAADAYPRYFPLLITAAGTARPAEVLVLGAGVAGLSAIGTAHRLGAVVRAYDVRPTARGEIESLGAAYLELPGPEQGAGQGGYARALTDEEEARLRDALTDVVPRHDIVITTAQVPGRRPPLLVSERAVAAMRPGSVVVDLGAGPMGGNVAVCVPDERIVTANGVTVVGAGNLPAAMPTAASTAYARNVAALLAHLVTDGEVVIDLTDEIQAGVVITHGGEVVQPATAALLAPRAQEAEEVSA
ncbi:MAG: Re/Si-specific NAD(P)(+) transhydrogenase subunit alpha [Frankia sp.]|nr:Re/Si-specific NAD(P)(+) transhydrogenase subunit alpha [Frankia sp.]